MGEWKHNYEIGEKVNFTEAAGFTWDAEVTEVNKYSIQVKWQRNRRTHPQWENYNRAYEPTWSRLHNDNLVKKK